MNYLQAVAYIESLSPTLLDPSLERIAAFMDESGRVQMKFQSIHIGGTNGKGSTVALVDTVLRKAGLNVGRFTGPHLLRWNERFHVNGTPVEDDEFALLATEVRERSEAFGEKYPQSGSLTWFEYLTAIAFFYFAKRSVDVAVIEVGLGGRWDATNVLESPLCSGITSIDYDHTHILGNSLEEIAREKAGIIKPGVALVTAATGVALSEIETVARAKGSPCIRVAAPNSVAGLSAADLGKITVALSKLALAGRHQESNALVAGAILAVAGKELNKPLPDYCSQGFASVYWPGRFQYLPKQNCVLDGAHNVAGAIALRETLDTIFDTRKRAYVMGFFQNKDVEGFLSKVLRPGDIVYAAEPATRRAVYSAAAICELSARMGASAIVCETVAAAFDQASSQSQDRLIIASGSFATVRELMQHFGCHCVEDLQAATLSNWSQVAELH